jgi:hypothetical protein
MSNVSLDFIKEQQRNNKLVNDKRLWKLKQSPCVDCGLRWHPHCMTLDHIDRKGLKVDTKNNPVSIASIKYWNPKRFNEQLKLMDLVCRNCHMIRELKRDINDPKIKPDIKHLYVKYLEKCNGGLKEEQSLIEQQRIKASQYGLGDKK